MAGGCWLSGRYFPSFEIKKLSTRKSVTGEHRECTKVTREIGNKWGLHAVTPRRGGHSLAQHAGEAGVLGMRSRRRRESRRDDTNSCAAGGSRMCLAGSWWRVTLRSHIPNEGVCGTRSFWPRSGLQRARCAAPRPQGSTALGYPGLAPGANFGVAASQRQSQQSTRIAIAQYAEHVRTALYQATEPTPKALTLRAR